MFSDLNPNQKRFCEEYLLDLNATQAAIRAGYSADSAHVQGPRLIGNARVRRHIDALMGARSIRTQVTADRVLLELARVGFADVANTVAWGVDVVEETDAEGDPVEDDEGVPRTRRMNRMELVPSNELSGDITAAISEVSVNANGEIKLKMHAKLPALVEMGKHLGITQKIEHSGPNGGPIETKEITHVDRAKALAFIFERAKAEMEPKA